MLSSLDLQPKFPSMAATTHHVFSKLRVVHVQMKKRVVRGHDLGLSIWYLHSLSVAHPTRSRSLIMRKMGDSQGSILMSFDSWLV